MCRATRDKVCHTTKCARNEKEGLYARRKTYRNSHLPRIRSRWKARPSSSVSRTFLVAGPASNEIRVVRDESYLDYAHSRREGNSCNQDNDSRNSSCPRPPRDSNRELANRGFPRRSPSSRDVFPILLFLLPRGRGGRGGRTWMFKRDTRTDRGKLDGISHATGSADTFRYRGKVRFMEIATA